MPVYGAGVEVRGHNLGECGGFGRVCGPCAGILRRHWQAEAQEAAQKQARRPETPERT